MKANYDSAWRRRALTGEKQAIRQLADDAIHPLYAFCFYRVGNDHAICEDVVQETMLIAITRLDRYDPARAEGDIFGWLTGLARNEIRRTLTKMKHTVSLEAMWRRMDQDLQRIFASIESQPFDDSLLQRDETRQMVNVAMSQLPAKHRQVLEAKYLIGQTVRDIALALNITEKAVESQLSRARVAFRQTFSALTHNLEIDRA